MGKKSKSGPAAPDYTALAEKTAASQNLAATQNTYANRPNQSTPWGSSTWSSSQGIDPATGKPVTNWSQNISLDPKLQSALDAQMGITQGRSELAGSMMDRVSQDMSQPFSYEGMQGYGAVPTSQALQGKVGGAGDYVSQAGNAMYGQASSRLDPQWQQRQEDLDTKLANMGITRGSAAYAREMQNFNQGRNDAYNQANFSSIIGSGQEAARMQGMDINQAGLWNQTQGQQFGQDLTSATYANQLRTQQIQEEAMRRGMSLNEMNALLSGQQVGMPQMPSFMAGSPQQGVDYMGAGQQQYQAALDQYNAQKASKSGMFGTIGTIGGGIIGGIYGGPQGAMVGSKIGGSLGGMIG